MRCAAGFRLARQASSSDRSQLPGAGDAPFLNGLFRSTCGLSQKRELVILIERFVTACLPNPYLEPHTLMLALADELEAVLEKDDDQYHILKAINLRLLDFARDGKKVLLCMDEAQAMPVETLEALRL